MTPSLPNELPAAAPFAGYGNGHEALEGANLRLFHHLDQLFLGWAKECQAEEYQFPVMLPARELAKIGYFKSFPQHVTVPASLHAEHDNLSAFATSAVVDEEGALQLGGCDCAPMKDILTPAACYHFYVNFQGQSFAAPRYLTTRALCFRREQQYAQGRRQWSFSMREIVCIGTASEVTQFLDAHRHKLGRFFSALDLPVSWETATDPFFNPQSNPKYLAQKLDPVKTEMVFKGELAIGSVNFHRNYFGEAFDISRDGEDAFSGCVAFGIERWMHAITACFGADERRWPDFSQWRHV